MQKITPCLWFDNKGEEATHFYTSIFKDSKIVEVVRYTDGRTGEEDQVLTVTFQLNGQDFMILNAGPEYHFTPAISFPVDCKSQEEVDHYWEKLTEGGFEEPCGWLRDKYGVSWQIVPERLTQLLQDKDPGVAKRVMEAMMQMKKIEIPILEEAAFARA